MKEFKKYFDSVEYLEGLNNLTIEKDYLTDSNHADIYIKRMRYLLKMIGNPDDKIKFIHIAGTSGKGTVSNMLQSALNLAGKNVGTFTSPAVTTTIEKIKVNHDYISPNEFGDIVNDLKVFIDKAYIQSPYGLPSYYELLLAIALVYFKQQKCEYVVLEVGLGGRFDATNVIEKPLVTAITNIDFDHTKVLGKTLKKIAYDKAGIIKSGSKFFTTEQRPGLLNIFKNICVEKNVTCIEIEKQSTYMNTNEALASKIAESLDISDKNFIKALKKNSLPCRFEKMQEHPITILDGAHNRSKIRSTIVNLGTLEYKKLYLIIGMADDKDNLSILNQIIPLADTVLFTKFKNKDRKCYHPKELFKKSEKYLKKSAYTALYLDAEDALTYTQKNADNNDVILVVGSFLLTGELRKNWYTEEFVLRNRNSFSKTS